MPPLKDWPHAPIHRISSDGIYMVTGATLHKDCLFPTDEKLGMLEHDLLTLAKQYEWQLEAWAVFAKSLSFRRSGSRGSEITKKVSPTSTFEYRS